MTSIFDQRPEYRAMETRIFEQRMEQFSKNWAPDVPAIAARFHSEFHALVREIYYEAQKPLMEQLSTLIQSLQIITSVPLKSKK